MARRIGFAQVPGVRLGHASTPDGASGVTVVRFDHPSPVVADVRGGASATYDLASLSVDATFGRRWAIFLAGGSLYGLDAARGVRTRILEEGDGAPVFQTPHRVIPIVGAALFDLPPHSPEIPDYLPLGYEAARVASHSPEPRGRIGAGAGASVGKYLGRARSMPGGLASGAERIPRGGTLGVLVVVNAVGAVRDPVHGRWVAGARSPSGRVSPPPGTHGRPDGATNTTLAVVVTDLPIPRPGLQRIAVHVSAGLARVIVPYNTSVDGDVVFVASTERARSLPREQRPGELVDRVGARAAELAGRLAVRAVRPGA